MVVQLAFDHLVRSGDNGCAELRIEAAERHVGLSGSALDDAECTDDRSGLTLPANLEIAERTLRLSTPVAIRGNFDGTERIRFRA